MYEIMFWEKPQEKTQDKTQEDCDFKGSDYMVVTTVVWRFLWVVWSQKTIKSFHKLKEEDKLRPNLHL